MVYKAEIAAFITGYPCAGLIAVTVALPVSEIRSATTLPVRQTFAPALPTNVNHELDAQLSQPGAYFAVSCLSLRRVIRPSSNSAYTC